MYNLIVLCFLSEKDPESHTAKVLTFLALPGHVVFFFTIVKIKSSQSEDPVNGATLTVGFILFYLSILLLQVIIFEKLRILTLRK